MDQSEYLVKLREEIAEKRIAAGLSRNVLAGECDMDRQNMHKIVKGLVTNSMLTIKGSRCIE